MTIREASRESRGRVSRRGLNGPKIDQETAHVIMRWTRRASTVARRDTNRDAPRRWTGVMFNAYYNFLLEFSYWPIFSQQVYSFIVGMYFLDIFIAMGLESMLCESLLIAPIDVRINVIENTMTMGAASFVDFMVSFMVGLSITMIDRLYLGPAVDTVTTLIPRC